MGIQAPQIPEGGLAPPAPEERAEAGCGHVCHGGQDKLAAGRRRWARGRGGRRADEAPEVARHVRTRPWRLTLPPSPAAPSNRDTCPVFNLKSSVQKRAAFRGRFPDSRFRKENSMSAHLQ